MSESHAGIVVIGGGHAAGQLLVSLRKDGFAGPLTLVSDEPFQPYQRPALSKDYLAGKLEAERLMFRPASFYEAQNIDMRLGVAATRIDRSGKTVHLDDGNTLAWSGLALTTGTRVREINAPGADLPGVHYLRSIADVDAIRAEMEAVKTIVVIGGGFIGLEVAAVARAAKKQVTVLEMQDRVMPRVVSPTVSEFYQRFHKRRGVNIVTGARVASLADHAGRVGAVVCQDSSEYPAELVIVGIGVLPNVELAEACGLACANGIVVDEMARTSDPAIVAAGDVTNHFNPLLRRRLRLESVQNAVDQAKTAAATLQGREQPYAQVPWFWSDQFDLKMQMTGISDGYDVEVVRGNLKENAFSVFYFREGRLVAVDSINRPADHVTSRRLLQKGNTLSREQAADPDFDLKAAMA